MRMQRQCTRTRVVMMGEFRIFVVNERNSASWRFATSVMRTVVRFRCANRFGACFPREMSRYVFVFWGWWRKVWRVAVSRVELDPCDDYCCRTKRELTGRRSFSSVVYAISKVCKFRWLEITRHAPHTDGPHALDNS
jgi:hypothetical protein